MQGTHARDFFSGLSPVNKDSSPSEQEQETMRPEALHVGSGPFVKNFVDF